jgi:hypothetical protein
MIVPVPRGLLESLEPSVAPIESQPDLCAQFQIWNESRARFSAGLAREDPETVRRGWERHYMRGLDSEGRQFEAHQTKLNVRDFARR